MSRKIAVASTIWGASILLSRVIGLVREAVIGRTLGGSAAADVYWTAFVVPDFLNYLLAGGALSIVFIPIFGAYLARGEEARGWDAFSSIATFVCIVLGALTVVLYFALPDIVPLVAPGFDAVQRAEVVALTRIILPAQIFHVVGGLLSAALQARDRHVVPALAPLVYTSCIVIGGLVGGRAAGAYGFAWGVLAGSVLGPFGLPLAACARSGLRWTLRCDLRDRDLRGYLVRSLPIMLAWSIVVVDDWYLKRQGSLVGEGAVATLTYAKNLMRVPIGVFGLAAGVAAYPALTRLVAEQRIGEMHRTVIATVRSLLVLSFAAQAVLSVCGDEIATLVYGQRRISPEELHDIGTCLALVSIGLSAWSAQTVLARGFYALGNTWLPALLGTGIALVAYPVYVVARQSLGTYGLALSSSAAVIAYTLSLAWFFERRVARDDPGASAASAGTVSFVMRAAAALAIAVAAGVSAGAALPRADAPGMTIVRALSLAALTTAIFAGFSHLFGVREVAAMLRPIAARVRTSSRRSHETV